MKSMKKLFTLSLTASAILLTGCTHSPVAETRYQQSDAFIEQISKNISEDPTLTETLQIDHSRLATAAGATFAPTRVIMFDNDALESKMLKQNQQLALAFPLKVLAYESSENDQSHIIWNDISYLFSRYKMQFSDVIEGEYDLSMKSAVKGIASERIDTFSNNTMQDDGIITLKSKLSFEESVVKATKAIKSNSDVTVFDTIDYQAKAENQGVDINKTTLIMFGAPKPGGESMSGSQTLGLDAFPQKLLVWQDNSGVHISYNKLTTMADRQDVHKTISLRVIQYRLNSTFEAAFD